MTSNVYFHEFVKMGKGSARLVFDENKQILHDLSPNYIKQIDSMLPCVCSVGSLSNHDDDGNKNPTNLHI